MKSGYDFGISHSYLNERASHCKGVFGSWIWIIEKTILVEIFGSPLHLVFFDGDWKVYCFLAFGYLWWDLYFFWNIVLSTGGRLQLGRFCRGSSTRLYQGVFISIIVIYDFILLFFCSICSFLLTHQIWYGWRLLCKREGALISLGKSFHIEAFSKSSQIDRDGIDHHHQGIYKVIQVRSTC